MRAASVARYLSLALLALFLIRCGTDAEQPIAELTEVDEETSASAAPSGASPDSPAETTASTAAVAEPPAGEETPSQTAQAAQQVVDQAADIDAKEAYARALQAFRSSGESASCEPTRQDMLGPFYEPGAPERTSVGSGYVLSGAVLAAGSCEPVSDARIELWLTNPGGVYDDAHRATVPVGGEYLFESNVPVSYENRPPHIHLRVTAPGYQELVTQHYPDTGQTEANFDLVLEPA